MQCQGTGPGIEGKLIAKYRTFAFLSLGKCVHMWPYLNKAPELCLPYIQDVLIITHLYL